MVFKVQTDVLHKTIRQLSNKVLYNGEHCLNLRNTRTPPLIDMEPWLLDKIQATTDPY